MIKTLQAYLQTFYIIFKLHTFLIFYQNLTTSGYLAKKSLIRFSTLFTFIAFISIRFSLSCCLFCDIGCVVIHACSGVTWLRLAFADVTVRAAITALPMAAVLALGTLGIFFDTNFTLWASFSSSLSKHVGTKLLTGLFVFVFSRD